MTARSTTSAAILRAVKANLPGDLRQPPDLRYGPTVDDVQTALMRLHLAEQRTWSPTEARRITATLEQIVRERRPMYHVEPQVLDPGLASHRRSVALVFDPDGGADNRAEALEAFDRSVAERTYQATLAAMTRGPLRGEPVDVTARRAGVSKRTLYTRRAELRSAGADPDHLAGRTSEE